MQEDFSGRIFLRKQYVIEAKQSMPESMSISALLSFSSSKTGSELWLLDEN